MAPLPEEALRDLRRSGLTDKSIEQMRIRAASLQDLPFTALTQHNMGGVGSVGGYVLPYFTPLESGAGYTPLEVDEIPFTRVRLLYENGSGENGENGGNNGHPSPAQSRRYVQRADSGTHVYFPPLAPSNKWWDLDTPLLITEGEKKAAAGTQAGFLTCGVGGIDSWRSRKLKIPADQVDSASARGISVTLSDSLEMKMENKVCDEFLWLPLDGRDVYVCFDTDLLTSKQDSCSRAAFDLCVWLESQGANPRQVILPPDPRGKMGLDDYLLQVDGAVGLKRLVTEAQFPSRPKIKSWVRRQLENPRRPRAAITSAARGILSDLDKKGTRYRDPFGIFRYFDRQSDKLYSLPIEGGKGLTQAAPEFHQQLVRQYGISSADRDLESRLTDMFESLPPINHIAKVHRQSYAAPGALYYQLTDSQMARVTPTTIETLRNGTDGVLFEAGAQDTHLYTDPIPEDFGWLKTLNETSLEALPGLTLSDTLLFAACLFYLSPWMRKWRGLMLPAEMAVSEPNSGKSSLYQLRQGIFTGSSRLGHQPEDMRSWYASIADARGIWVADNTGGKLDPRLSNEIARLITDPDPSFELRELYTTAKVARMPVDCVFAFTSIYNPFHRPDMLQRSVIFRFHAITHRDGGWLTRQLLNQGRSMWVTHHLQVLQAFLREAQNMEWGVSTRHRLVGFEQSMRCMGAALNKKREIERVLDALPQMVQENITAEEPVIEALKAFVKFRKRTPQKTPHHFVLKELCDWISWEPENRFVDLRVFRTPRLLEKYIEAHTHDVYSSSGIRTTHKEDVAGTIYEIDPNNPSVNAL